jgi:hypothetical protein
MKFYWLVLGILAVWRITSLIGFEDGPGKVFVSLRQAAGDGVLGKGLSCFYCLSLWVAVPFALVVGETWFERFVLWLALSAGAIVVQRITQRAGDDAAAIYIEDEEK